MKFSINTSSILALGAMTAMTIATSPLAADHHGSKSESKPASQAAMKNIVETAAEAGSFNTLLAAATAAGLAETLSTGGPFTVFAPTDDAFAALPEGTVEYLLKPENKDKLVSVLTYHVVPGKVKAADVVTLTGAETVNGQFVNISTKDGVKVDNANVVATDIMASNGIIHVIDAVIMPESKNIVEVASGAGSFNTLLAAATAAGLAETLSTGGPFTVFAPTDEAFAALPEGTVADLLKPENKDTLASILKLHVVSGRVYSPAVKDGLTVGSLGGDLNFAVNYGKPSVNGANIVATDIDASNGVVHVIDKVILP